MLHKEATMIKRCRKCHKDYPATLEFFYSKDSGKYRLDSMCKPCKDAYKKAYLERIKAEHYKAVSELRPAEVEPDRTCQECLWLAVCRERVRIGQWVACERPTEDDYRRMAIVEARR